MRIPQMARRLFDALASVRLAVVVMVTLATTCSVATFYEMRHGTSAAQRDIYRTGGFTFLLVLLGANIFCAMMKRYPWRVHHAGFVLAHVGILTLLTGSLISLHWGLDGNMALFERETGDRVSLLDKALQVSLPPGTHASFPVVFERNPPAAAREQRFPIPGSRWTLVAEDFRPHVTVDEGFREGMDPNPALHFILQNAFAREQGWLVASDPARSRANFGPAAVEFSIARNRNEASATLLPTGQNRIVFVGDPAGAVEYAVLGKDGTIASRGPLHTGATITTPWMDMTVQVDRLLRNATPERTLGEAPVPEKEDRRLPAVKVRLEGPNGPSPSEWIAWTESRPLRVGDGEAIVGFRSPEVGLPFRVTLLDFRSDKYPGSSMAATYESRVRVEDAERGASEHLVSMNHPLHYRGYIFFQASFVEGEPMMSIFSVARAPGLPLVYTGTSLISLGVLWMFYMKPYLARRQAAYAVSSRRQRENLDEARRNAVRAHAGPAEPASSGL